MSDIFFGEAVKTLEILVKSLNGYYSCRNGWAHDNRGSFNAASVRKPQRIYTSRRKVMPCNRLKERRAF